MKQISGYTKKESSKEGKLYNSAKVSNALLDAITPHKKENAVLFLDNNKEYPQYIKKILSKGNYIKEESKEVGISDNGEEARLSLRMKKILLVLGVKLGRASSDEKDNYISLIDRKVNPLITQDEYDSLEEIPTPLRGVIDIKELSREIYSRRKKLGGKEINYIKEDLFSLSNLRFTVKYKDAKGGTLTILTNKPLLTINSGIKYENKENVTIIDIIDISFSDIFGFGLNTKGEYQTLPKNIVQTLNSANNDTEVFGYLSFQILKIRGIKISNAEKKIQQRKNELNKKGESFEKIELEIANIKESVLSYEENLLTILDKIDKVGRYYYSSGERKGKIRKDQLKKDITKACEDLKKIGLIKSFCITKNTNEEEKVKLLINESFSYIS